MDPDLDAVRSAAPFVGWLREAIIDFKYHDERDRAEHLGTLLAEVLVAMAPLDALVPVPLHPKRLRARGYNQSALIAQSAGAALGLPVFSVLERTRATPRQVGLGGAERIENVAAAFAVAPGLDLSSLRLVLVDDVVTTGSTLGACAAVLRGSGAGGVRAATLAREL